MFGLSVEEFAGLSRYDKKILRYYLMLKNYYEGKSIEKAEREAKRKGEFKGKMPGQVSPGGR